MKWLSIITAAREININCKDILISAGSVDFEGHTYDIFNLLDNLTNQNVA
ncbi:MAG: hypothetical protein MJ223_02825 [Mycoplasmoidaceae bacterium]|nr:hypothetical protein [Mycoplasmoidaceae bacterium]